MSVQDCIASFVDGRVRLRHSALKDADTAELVCSVLRGMDGISSAEANPRAGSLLLFYDPLKLSREQLLALTEQAAEYLPDEHGATVESPAFASNIIEGAEEEKGEVDEKGVENKEDKAAENCDIGALSRLAVVNALSGYAKLARLIEREGERGGKAGGGQGGPGRGGCQNRMGGGRSVGTALGLLSGVLSAALPGKFSKTVIGGAATVLPTVAKVLSKGMPAKGAETSRGSGLTAGEAAKLLTSRRVNRLVNRSMLAALGLSLAALPQRRSFLHTAAGGVFLTGLLQHLLAHRKLL